MAIPDFQSLMLPLLKVLADKQEHAMREVMPLLSDQFQLSEAERSLSSPISGQPVMYNRTAWAKTYLKKAGLIEQPRRGYFKISERGERVLESSPALINMKFLEQFAEYVSFKDNQEQTEIQQQVSLVPEIQAETPEELIESGARTIRKELAGEILQRVKSCPPVFF